MSASLHLSKPQAGCKAGSGEADRQPFSADAREALALSRSALAAQFHGDVERRLDLATRLHRDVAGSLVASKALSEMLRQELSSKSLVSPALEGILNNLDTSLRQTLHIVRDLTEEQFPPALKAFGLCVALQQLVRAAAEQFVGALMFHIKGEEPKFDPSKRSHVYRLVETLIRRSVRSEGVSWIEVTFEGLGDRVEITIDHDGQQDTWDQLPPPHEQEAIRARCALLGAVLDASQAPTNRCCRLTLSVPLNAAPQVS